MAFGCVVRHSEIVERSYVVPGQRRDQGIFSLDLGGTLARAGLLSFRLIASTVGRFL